MGKWFKDGLTKEALKNAYRELAKTWHPDLHTDNHDAATKSMQEINDEYDTYFTRITFRPTASTKREAEESRKQILLFMVKNKRYGELGKFVSPSLNNGPYFLFHGKMYYSNDDKSWNGAHSGLSLCEYAQDAQAELLEFEISGSRVPATFELPTFADILDVVRQSGTWRLITEVTCASSYTSQISHINTQFGELVILDDSNNSVKIITRCNGSVMTTNTKKKYLGEIEVLEKYSISDIFFIEHTGYSASEFMDMYDVNYKPSFADVIPVKQITQYLENPTIGYCIRRSIVKVYQSTMNYRMKYGTFTADGLATALDQGMSMDDINEVQDFLDQINKDFDENIKRMIKKGTIKIKI